jgi:hypothetical protein
MTKKSKTATSTSASESVVFGCRLDRATMAAMVSLHGKTGCTPAEMVRRALAAYLKKQGVLKQTKKRRENQR